MKRMTFILALLGCIFMGVQCEKDDDGLFGNSDNNNDKNQNEEPTLPPATQSGKGTFGCKVNGEVWVPEAPPNINELHADYYKGEFFVSANREINDENTDQGMAIRIDTGWKGEGIYKLSSKFWTNKYAIFINSKNGCEYTTDTFNTGKLKITHFDSSKRIVSGRFHFTAILKQGNCEKDTIQVTDGRFDIKKGY